MSKQFDNLFTFKRPDRLTLTLWHDRFREEPLSADGLIARARILDTEFSRPGVREQLESGPMLPDSYQRLRHLLFVLRRAEVTGDRRLTLWERITGRLQR